MTHKDIGQLILGFEHRVAALKSEIPLITSDRPILMTSTLTEDDACIIFPIGPKKVYLCGKSENTVLLLLNKIDDEFVQFVNDQVARHAAIAVYSTDQDLDEYVAERLGKDIYESLFARVSRSLADSQ